MPNPAIAEIKPLSLFSLVKSEATPRYNIPDYLIIARILDVQH